MANLKFQMPLRETYRNEKVNSGNMKELAALAITKLLEDDNPYYRCLRKQLSISMSANLSYDGYGFVVNFEADPMYKIIYPDVDYDIISGVIGVNSLGQDVCGFALFVEHGLLSQLDAYSIQTDTWSAESIRLLYAKTDNNGELIFCESGTSKSLEDLITLNCVKNESGDIFTVDGS